MSPQTGMLFSDLGWVQASMQNIEAAERSYQHALRLLPAARHPVVAITQFRLAKLKLEQQQYSAAASLLEKVNSDIEKLDGPVSPGFVTTAPAYALALRKTGRKAEAKLVEKRAARIRETIPAEFSGKHTVDFTTLISRSR